MGLYDILMQLDTSTLATSGVVLVVLLLSFVQVSKIEINPWSWIGKVVIKGVRALGSLMNSDLSATVDKMGRDLQGLTNTVDGLSAEVKAIQEDREEEKAKAQRTRILRFGDELRNKQPHTKEHFDDILADISGYERYCAEHPNFENDKAALTIKYIEETYTYCMKNDSFL